MYYIDLPPGIFRFFLDIWYYLRNTFVELVYYFTDTAVNLGGEEVSLLSVLISSGFLVYVGVAIIKWVIGIVL